jgi:hypothetical protein
MRLRREFQRLVQALRAEFNGVEATLSASRPLRERKEGESALQQGLFFSK